LSPICHGLLSQVLLAVECAVPAPDRAKVLLIFGTRPEAIKMAPVIRALSRHKRRFQLVAAITSQHREMLDQVLELFGIRADCDLAVMTENQTLSTLTARILERLEPVFQREKPDLVMVQGDTTTTLCGALAAFYHRVPVAHVEAGLRTGNLDQPYPEEANRVMTSVIASLHLAPTETARANLRREGIPADRIFVTGNTSIDALLWAARLPQEPTAALRDATTSAGGPKLLVTAHRRENHGAPLGEICRAVQMLIERHPAAEVIFPVHLNPRVQEVVREMLGGVSQVKLLPPLGYRDFVHAMMWADLILTDSGGVQEEAPSLGKPVLVLRETTERPEAIAAGTARLVGTASDRIVAEAMRLLTDKAAYEAMAHVRNPYGDGRAATRIVAACRQFLDRSR
jgi:UDP-N-acetylglucosamine 2-epimerase (non-hydrolysing)